jgi:glyoxylase-like metal-dependent hydrolase (beta-lactamase superfamily II)
MNIDNLAENAEDFTGEIWHIKDYGILIDAGTGDSWKQVKQLEEINTVLVTHPHYDHVDNLSKIVEKFSPEIYAFESENLKVEAERYSDGDTVEVEGVEFNVFHTPGHKDDSVCLYVESEKVLFTGDLIFPDGGFGRTDLAEGDRDKLIESIEKVAELDVREMYTGHGPAVTEDANEQIGRSLEEARKHEAKY